MCWLSPEQPKHKKPRTEFRAKKVLYAIAFDAYGALSQVCVPKGQTVTRKFYSTQVISAVEKCYIERRPIKSGLVVLNYCTIMPVAIRRSKSPIILKKLGCKLLITTPYSPDLSPCDFWLFLSSRNISQGRISIPDQTLDMQFTSA